MGYTSKRGFAALRQAKTELDNIEYMKITADFGTRGIVVLHCKFATIEGNLKIADKEGLSIATKELWDRLQIYKDHLEKML